MVHLIGIPAVFLAGFASAWIWKSHLVHEADKLKAAAQKELGK